MLFPQINKVIMIGYAYDEPSLRSRKPNEERVQLELVTHCRLPAPFNYSQDQSSQRVLITAYGSLAMYIVKTIHKGTCFYVEGQLHTLPKKLQERYFSEVLAQHVTTMAHKKMTELRYLM